MNEEDRLFAELKYGINLSYGDFRDFYQKVVGRLPRDFALKHNLYRINVMYIYTTEAFKAKLIDNLKEYYSNE